MGKCKFSDKWLENFSFSWWLKAVPKDDSEAYCAVCCKRFKLGTMGIKALESHMQSGKHVAFATARQHQPQINDFCTATANGQEGARPQPAEQPQTSSDIRTIFGSTPTLRAEVIWVLRTVTSHQPYRSNDGIDDIFKAMFPDSVLAQSFTCGKDKSRYVAAFGLAPYFKKELIAEVKSSGPFVVMFDESLNYTTKNKQLDLHVRFWKNNHVQSRFYGSQFLGHATAQDLLHHFKVSAFCLLTIRIENMYWPIG